MDTLRSSASAFPGIPKGRAAHVQEITSPAMAKIRLRRMRHQQGLLDGFLVRTRLGLLTPPSNPSS